MYKLEDIITPTHKGFKVRKVRVKALSDEKEFFDDAFPNGLFIEPRGPHQPRTKLRPMLKYCKELGKTPSELTEEEIKKFTIYP
ncbi:hypothetical protein [Mesobacillus boroniphilus]|uniref:hypothetical protein n=1 Tax=Mesobacillus boroniphilus TaxID=308892 RepID=UPI0011DD6228|nr:hypothetical protein [Mesobacillus boroniphilus]